MHAPRLRIMAQPLGRLWPNVHGRTCAKYFFIAFERLRILIKIAVKLDVAACRRPVVQWAAKHVGAETLPIITRVTQVEMPCLIDGIRRRHRVIDGSGQKNETFILSDNARRVINRPAIFAFEPISKAECSVSRANCIGNKPLPDRVICLSGRVSKRIAHLILY